MTIFKQICFNLSEKEIIIFEIHSVYLSAISKVNYTQLKDLSKLSFFLSFLFFFLSFLLKLPLNSRLWFMLETRRFPEDLEELWRGWSVSVVDFLAQKPEDVYLATLAT